MIDHSVLVAAATGFFSAFGAGVAMRNDISWLKQLVEKMDKRITLLEQKRHGDQ